MKSILLYSFCLFVSISRGQAKDIITYRANSEIPQADVWITHGESVQDTKQNTSNVAVPYYLIRNGKIVTWREFGKEFKPNTAKSSAENAVVHKFSAAIPFKCLGKVPNSTGVLESYTNDILGCSGPGIAFVQPKKSICMDLGISQVGAENWRRIDVSAENIANKFVPNHRQLIVENYKKMYSYVENLNYSLKNVPEKSVSSSTRKLSSVRDRLVVTNIFQFSKESFASISTVVKKMNGQYVLDEKFANAYSIGQSEKSVSDSFLGEFTDGKIFLLFLGHLSRESNIYLIDEKGEIVTSASIEPDEC